MENEKKYGKIIVDRNHKDIIYEIKENGCHKVISHASSGKDGYFKIKIDSKSVDIHRWYYQREKGIDLTKLDVRHKCDNTKCINIKHLCHGSRQDNVNDMLSRNRQDSILTIEDVKEIVRLYNTNKFTYKNLAKKFNVSDRTIASIFRSKTWSHITSIKDGDYPTRKAKYKSNEKYIIWDEWTNKWRVFIYIGKKRKHIDRTESLSKAIEIRDKFLLENNINGHVA